MPHDWASATEVPPAASIPLEAMRRINPSSDVQQQVAATIEACTQWLPERVDVAIGPPVPPTAATEVRVCDLHDRWPVMQDQQQDLLVFGGAMLGIGAAVLCAAVWIAFRRALGSMSWARC